MADSEEVGEKRKLPSVYELMSQSLIIYRTRFRTLTAIAVIPLLVFIPSLSISNASLNKLGNLGLAALLVVAFFILGWSYTALLFAVSDPQSAVGFKVAYRRGLSKAIPYWWISFLIGLIGFGGLVLFVLPGVLFFIWFALAAYILVSENLRGMNALLKSKEYVKGYWFPVFWRLLVFFIFFSIPYIPQAVFERLGYDLVSNILLYIYFPIVTPIAAIYGFLIYKNLRSIKGEFSFTPRVGQKIKYIITGLVGILLLIPVVVAGLFLFGKTYQPAEKQPIIDTQPDISTPVKNR